jgi:hypothetical protein
MAKGGVGIVRVYEDPGGRRGERRVLVDRLWSRGLSKEVPKNRAGGRRGVLVPRGSGRKLPNGPLSR